MNIETVKIVNDQDDNASGYKLVASGTAYNVPIDQSNRHYQAVQDWIAAGNTPEPADVEPGLTYAEQRAAEYPPIGDQLDDLFHAGLFSAGMASKIQAVKDKYPKS